MRRSVLSPRSAECQHWLARHFPPPVLNVFATHVRDLTGALAGKEDHLQGAADDKTGVIERLPE